MQQREQGVSKYIPGVDAIIRAKKQGYPVSVRAVHGLSQIVSPFMYECGHTPSNYILDTLVDVGFAAMAFLVNAGAKGNLTTGLGLFLGSISLEKIAQQAFIAKNRRR